MVTLGHTVCPHFNVLFGRKVQFSFRTGNDNKSGANID